MLNTTNIRMGSHTSNVSFNATSTGMMQRSNPKSFFLRFHKSSKMAERIFPIDGKKSIIKRKGKYSYNEDIEIEVLQILVFGDDEFLVEAIDLENLKDSI